MTLEIHTKESHKENINMEVVNDLRTLLEEYKIKIDELEKMNIELREKNKKLEQVDSLKSRTLENMNDMYEVARIRNIELEKECSNLRQDLLKALRKAK